MHVGRGSSDVNGSVQDGLKVSLLGPDEHEPSPVSCKPVRRGGAELAGHLVERCFGWGIDRRTPPTLANSSGWRLTAHDTARSFEPPSHCTGRARRRPAERRTLLSSPPSPSPSPCPSYKPGLTAFEPGSSAILDLPLSETQSALRSSSWKATLHVTYLTSYDGMGAVVVDCVRGCNCGRALVDGHSSNFVSIWLEHHQNVEVHAGSSACSVRLVVQNDTRAIGTKFKVSALTLSWREGVGESSTWTATSCQS